MDIHDLKIFLMIAQEGSVSKLNTTRDGIRVLKTIVALFRDYRPYTFFSFVSIFFLLVSLAFFTPVFLEYYCSSTCCLYLCSFYGGYFRRKEIKDLTGQIKKGKLKFIKNMSDEGRPRHRKGPKKQSVR